jgi:N-dimethylarginine dimethylaminohydrolase
MRRAVLTLVLGGAVAAGAPAPSDDTGAVATWIWHFDGEMRVACLPTYRGLLRVLPADARIVVGVRGAEDARECREELNDPRLRFVEAGEWVSGWARDRYILFAKDGKDCLLLPRREAVVPTRLGDLAVAQELKKLAPELVVTESDLVLEGGDLVFTAEEVIAGPAVVAVNVKPGERTEADVRAKLEEVFGRRLVTPAKRDSPLAREHVDMYLAVAGPRKLLLGDPRLGLAALEQGEDVKRFGRFTPEKQAELAKEYDAIEERLLALGFEVRRLPILHAADHVILTWTNAVVDARRVYVPEYGLKRLDRLAQETWAALGFEPVPIDAEAVIVLGGGIRCVTNAVRVAPPPPEPSADTGR